MTQKVNQNRPTFSSSPLLKQIQVDYGIPSRLFARHCRNDSWRDPKSRGDSFKQEAASSFALTEV